ncbi:tektin-2 isoform X1 [Numida meleagris]|uniref:tektin-2 isoform X1 n=1 Tax=Numida meleagris TaxID=8996 RepID=UPI000B3DB0BB|nr:tektin-2 isoform X1 [Numida meleagris]XP_021231183.1 tektin-2 isoform X1 [Numida meleagris]XP_021231184.1 tektin-2 isoform X1 [Numida meleagris]
MAALSVKPGQRFTVPDWDTNARLISADAESQRSASHQLRQEARALRNETNNQAKWDEHDNQTRLAERISSVNRWKETLDKCLADIDEEINALAKVKEAAERALQAKNLSWDVARECLTLRDGRRAIDVVRDPAEEQLHKEVKVIDKAKRELQQRVNEAFEQLCLLQEARQQLSMDHRGKMEALEIDRTCLSLSVNSPNISFKVNPTRIPNGTTAVDEWEQNSQYNKDHAEEEMKASTKLREAIVLAIAQTNNELEAQRVATEFALRKRIRDMERAYDELKWQEKNVNGARLIIDHSLGWGLDAKETLEEIAEMEEDIRRLEEDLRRKMQDLKVAHTRLETRTYRPNVELCRDQAQYGLTDEVHALEGSIRALKLKLAEAQDALDALYRQLHRVQTDMACKAHSLVLDHKCMDSRRKLVVPAEKFVPRVDTFNRTENRAASPPRPGQLELG